VPVRKFGKMPGKCVEATYEKEYGKDVFELQADALGANARVVVVDDILATGGTAHAAGELVKMAGGEVLEYCFLMELELGGAAKLEDGKVWSLFDRE